MRSYLRKYKRSPYWYFKLTERGQVVQDWKSTGKRLKREAADYAARKLAAAESSNHAITIDEAFGLLAAHKERRRASAATMEKLSVKASHVRTFFGPARDITSITLQETTAYLDKRRRDGVKDSTIELEMRELCAALRQLKLFGKYHREPGALWPDALAHSFPGRKRWLTMAEYDAILRELRAMRKGTRDWSEHLIAYCWSGMRLSELYRPTAADIGDELHIAGTKTENSNRYVPIHPELARVLRRRAELHPEGPLFPLTSPDEQAEKSSWLRALKTACRRAGVPAASTNDLRRTFCSWCWQAGVDMALVIRWMGHASSRMVVEVYAHPSAAQNRREIGKLLTLQSPPEPPIDETGGNS